MHFEGRGRVEISGDENRKVIRITHPAKLHLLVYHLFLGTVLGGFLYFTFFSGMMLATRHMYRQYFVADFNQDFERFADNGELIKFLFEYSIVPFVYIIFILFLARLFFLIFYQFFYAFFADEKIKLTKDTIEYCPGFRYRRILVRTKYGYRHSFGIGVLKAKRFSRAEAGVKLAEHETGAHLVLESKDDFVELAYYASEIDKERLFELL